MVTHPDINYILYSFGILGRALVFWVVFWCSGKCIWFFRSVWDSAKRFDTSGNGLDSEKCVVFRACFRNLGSVLDSGKYISIMGNILDCGDCFGILDVFCILASVLLLIRGILVAWQCFFYSGKSIGTTRSVFRTPVSVLSLGAISRGTTSFDH